MKTTIIGAALALALGAAPALAGGVSVKNDANAESGSQSGSWSSVTVEGNAKPDRITGQVVAPLNGFGNGPCDRGAGPITWSEGTACDHLYKGDWIGKMIYKLHSPDPAERAGARMALLHASRVNREVRETLRAGGYVQ